MVQIQPGENFPIVRVLKDHTDTDTNYVRATVRDATTDALLATVDLDDKGDRRFHKLYKVPYDNVYSKGRFIVITTTVYTDSGYTTKNQNYTEEADTYLIQQRWDPMSYVGGNSEAKFDPESIRKVIQEEINRDELVKIIKAEVGAIPKFEPVELPPYPDPTEILNPIMEKIDTLKPVEQKPVDLSPVMSKIERVHSELSSRPKFTETDMTEIYEVIENLKNEIVDLNKKLELSLKDNKRLIQLTQEDRRKNYLNGLRAKYNI